MHRQCNCGCNSNMDVSPESYTENSCSDVSNTQNMCYDECECGYDDYNVFPENPILRTKLCAYPKNESNFYSMYRLKNGNYLSRISTPLYAWAITSRNRIFICY